jgi:formaldehyde-activating enzyme involved in methanogenesis
VASPQSEGQSVGQNWQLAVAAQAIAPAGASKGHQGFIGKLIAVTQGHTPLIAVLACCQLQTHPQALYDGAAHRSIFISASILFHQISISIQPPPPSPTA